MTQSDVQGPSSTESLERDLAAAVTDWRVLDPADETYWVDGARPRLACTPVSVEELAGAVRVADAHRAAVIPWGGGARMALGFPPRAADLVVRTDRLDEIVEYEPADLTVTVQAGIRLEALQSRLRAEGQMLALDPAAADRATIGGIIATNASGPLRLVYGTARDLVIGTRVVNADGMVSKAGGRVVKNVAGYDLNKLYIGSLGTLGIVVELSFKLHPLPQSEEMLLAHFRTIEDATAAVGEIIRSPLNPAAIELLDQNAATEISVAGQIDRGMLEDGYLLVVAALGFESAVRRQIQDLLAICRARTNLAAAHPSDHVLALWQALRGFADPSSDGVALLKATVPPARSAAALGTLSRIADEAGFRSSLLAHAGSGVVYPRLRPATEAGGSFHWGTDWIERLSGLVERARSYVRGEGGSLVVESCPPEAKAGLDVWGDPGSGFAVMRALKEKLDPNATLNPGRFVGHL